MTPSWKKPLSPGLGGIMLFVLLFPALCSCFYEYHFIDEPKSWNQARDYCRGKYEELATIDNTEDVTRVRAAVGSGFKGQVWFGLYDRVKWKRSDIKPGSPEDEEDQFTKWSQGEPNIILANKKICVAFRQGTWRDVQCHVEQQFVCYNSQTSLSSIVSPKYVLSENNSSWKDARTYCRSNHVDLAIIKNDSENTEVQDVVGDDRSVWIGFYRYAWNNWAGDNSDFMNWVQGHPKNRSEGCATSLFDAKHSGQWVEAHCGEAFPFVCHGGLRILAPSLEKKQIFRIKITKSETTADLNQPAVNEAILHQIKEKMEEMGITRDLKISWIKKSDEKVFSKAKKKADEVKMDLECYRL
ncbi:lymphocyte antigen 75-like%2C partial [Xyrichtys novacula]|uniref:Lymphocyte antigen 75-like, partial n=1 Tax=Xyrichtys novacula TaxID=13765 RepID=A0AAV1HNG9_XYRNO|nr:lymphocyte antigen 75-like%2C partial [Xyrichtys novacula]